MFCAVEQELPGDGSRKCHWVGVIDGATHYELRW